MKNNTKLSNPMSVGQKMCPYWWSGLSDVEAGRPFDPDYDDWKPAAQRNYERGRLNAINIRAAGLKIPVPDRMVMTKRFMDSYRTALSRVGHPYKPDAIRQILDELKTSV